MAPELQGKTLCLLDLDGTVYLGDRLLPGAQEFVHRVRQKMEVRFLTNNTSRTPEQYAKKLSKLGIATKAQHVISPLHQLLREIRLADYGRVYTLANRGVLRWLNKQAPDINWECTEDAQLLVVAYDDTLTYAKLCAATRTIQAGCPWWSTHPDFVCPAPGGPLPDCGSFVSLLFAATAVSPQRVLGKPDAGVVGSLLAKHRPSDCVFIGDRLYTDWELARSAGMDFVLVFTGETTPEMWRSQIEGPPQVCAGLDSLL